MHPSNNVAIVRSPLRRKVQSSSPLDPGHLQMKPLPDVPLPPSIRARYIAGINGLAMHVLEAGFETPGRPCLLLLHGFPELAYSWRKGMLPLAAAGFHVIAPDQRGYGRTSGGDASYDCELRQYFPLNLVRDALALVLA